MGAEAVLRDPAAAARPPRLADIDALTLDANGTLVYLVDPVPSLVAALATRGVERSPKQVAAAVGAEFDYYREHLVEGRDDASLERLRQESAAVFLTAAAADLDTAEFAPTYTGALRFELLPGVAAALERAAALGLELAVVSNWDVGLHEHLDRLQLTHRFRAVVTAAEAGARKPDPAIFAIALEALGVRPERTLHVGDGATDREGALAAGLHFAPAPFDDALAALA